MGRFVAVATGNPVGGGPGLYVGRGRPGVAVGKITTGCVESASRVRADAVYSSFKVANVSGVAVLFAKLQAS